MTVLPISPGSARGQLLITAERLIAEQGPSVSLREVAAEAGQRNNSAVSYHFGSRDGLIEAIIELRQASLERDRLIMLGELQEAGRDDLHALVEALLLPAMRTPYAEGATHYARFIEKVREHPYLASDALAARRWPATRLIIGRLHESIDDVPRRLRPLRLRAAFTTSFGLLADVERADPAYAGLTTHETEQHVVDMVLGVLTAPVSAR